MIVFPQGASAATTPQANIPPGWQTYTNPIYAYQISYPSSWHVWSGDPRTSQYLSNYDEQSSIGDFPGEGDHAKIEVDPFQKPATQPLAGWLGKMDADLRPSKPDDEPNWVPPVVTRNLTIAALPAITLRWDTKAPRIVEEYLDAGPVVYKIAAYWATGANSSLVQQMLASFRIIGAPDLAEAAIPPVSTPHIPLAGAPSAGLNLPLQVDYAGNSMYILGVNSGGVISWFDHHYPTIQCDGQFVRYDGFTDSPNWCPQPPPNGSGSCTQSKDCYDGHEGFDFSTGGQKNIPVYAANYGTVNTSVDSACGTGLYVVGTGNIETLYCHLNGYATGISNGVTVYRGQQIALSGCTGSCNGPHLHFGAYDMTKKISGSSNHPAVDPNGWSGSSTDPWGNNNCILISNGQSVGCDSSYLWSTGSQSSPAPSYICGPIYTVTPGLSGSWSSAHPDGYGVTYWYSSTSGATATWNAPNLSGQSCYGVEVWIPDGNATNQSAHYVIHFSDGNPNQTVTVNQNTNASWYTIWDSYNGNSHTISQVTLAAASGSETGAAKVWFQCF